MVPILVMNAILLIITILLAVADRLLVSYGQCKISVSTEEGKKEFTVQGGDTLLAALNQNKFDISSSCGGKASCGYCKVRVLEGGGQILPTEEIFMSRDEKLEQMRLACQVKVKNDVEIFVPDFLTTVRNIVKNKTYDPRRRSSFTVARQKDQVPDEVRIFTRLDKEEKSAVDMMIERHRHERGALILILQEINTRYTYFPEHVLFYIAGVLDVPLTQVFRVATFYNAFSLKPRGRNVIKVCLGTSCYVKGGLRILESLENKLGIKVGESTPDLKFSLETVNCIGCCGQSPVIAINDEIYGYFKQGMVDSVIDDFKEAVH